MGGGVKVESEVSLKSLPKKKKKEEGGPQKNGLGRGEGLPDDQWDTKKGNRKVWKKES